MKTNFMMNRNIILTSILFIICLMGMLFQNLLLQFAIGCSTGSLLAELVYYFITESKSKD